MKSIEIKGTIRENIGKKYSRKLRQEGQVLCVLYGGEEIVHFSADEKAFKDIIYTPNVYIIELNIDGKIYKSVMQDIQFHPVTDKILHVDFLQVSEDKEIKIGVPVKIYGDSEGVKQGGKLHLKHRKLNVKGLMKDLPDILEIDISDLGLGKTTKVRDLNYDNLELLDSPNDVICSVKLTRSSKSMASEDDDTGGVGGADAEEPKAEGEAQNE